MNTAEILELAWQSIYLILLLSAPAVLAAAVIGLLVSILQAATQVQEQTLSVVAKIIAVYAALALCGVWLLELMVGFAREAFAAIATA